MILRTGLFAALMCLAAHVTAQELQRHGDWLLLPLGGGACVLVQRVATADTGTRVADVFLSARGQGAVITLRVANGASIATPAAFRHPGGAAIPLTWQFCDPGNCTAQTELAAPERRRLERGRELEMAFVPALGDPSIGFSVSLMGVTKGLAAQGACPRP